MVKSIKLNTGKKDEQPVTEKKLIGTIDVTPSWSDLVVTWLDLYAEGGEVARTNALIEMKRMAAQADAWLAHCKERKPVEPHENIGSLPNEE